MILYTSIVALALASLSLSQTTDAPPCAEACAQQAIIAAGCGSLTNTTCICVDQPFVQDAAVCVATTCDLSDFGPAEAFFQQLCDTSAANPPNGTDIASNTLKASTKKSSTPRPASASRTPVNPGSTSTSSVAAPPASPSSSSTTSSTFSTSPSSSTSPPPTSGPSSSAERLALNIFTFASFVLYVSFAML